MPISFKGRELTLVTADPPVQSGTSASVPSPLQECVREAYESGVWKAFLGVPANLSVDMPARGGVPAHKISEAEAVAGELRRAARQTGLGIAIRRADQDGTDAQDIYFLVTKKRAYKTQRNAGNTAVAANGSGSQEEVPQIA